MSYQQKIAIPIRLAALLHRETRAGRMKKGSSDKAAVLVRELMKHSFRNDLHGNWVNLHSRKLFDLLGKKTYVQQLKRLESLGVIIGQKPSMLGMVKTEELSRSQKHYVWTENMDLTNSASSGRCLARIP